MHFKECAAAACLSPWCWKANCRMKCAASHQVLGRRHGVRGFRYARNDCRDIHVGGVAGTGGHGPEPELSCAHYCRTRVGLAAAAAQVACAEDATATALDVARLQQLLEIKWCKRVHPHTVWRNPDSDIYQHPPHSAQFSLPLSLSRTRQSNLQRSMASYMPHVAIEHFVARLRGPPAVDRAEDVTAEVLVEAAVFASTAKRARGAFVVCRCAAGCHACHAVHTQDSAQLAQLRWFTQCRFQIRCPSLSFPALEQRMQVPVPKTSRPPS